jgi:hypothetical protein
MSPSVPFPWNASMDRAVDQLVASVAEQPFRLGIDHDDLTGGVEHDHAARAGFDGQLEHFLRQPLL